MKTTQVIMALCAVFLIGVGAVNAQSSRSDLQKMYVSHLQKQGYQPEIDSDGDIEFKAEGNTFYIIVDEDDLESFRILYPSFWEIESLSEKAQVYNVVNYINRTTKIAKAYLNSSEDNVSMDVNIFIAEPEDFKPHFRRMVNLLIAERREFIDKMNE
ncbi:YbjN domain-containing protein [Parapedobacter lycopersici]|uniref:YbjN domain-containing protein n=1 Tax=Parapedobacter lycopersici TaxID=1864939 RepID=UPI00214DA8B3|nr:YbjN domain-containing protein [Parapedobacter lycopersici]